MFNDVQLVLEKVKSSFAAFLKPHWKNWFEFWEGAYFGICIYSFKC